jgi:hypothetical protein
LSSPALLGTIIVCGESKIGWVSELQGVTVVL